MANLQKHPNKKSNNPISASKNYCKSPAYLFNFELKMPDSSLEQA
jgi:hypothetical protein